MASKTTTDHEEIRKWVEARGGCPAHVKATGKRGDPGVLRIDYPGFSGVDSLESIEWDQWFAAFDENKLAFIYDTDKKSRFSKLVSRATARRAATKKRAAAGEKRPTTKRAAATKRPAAKKRAGAKARGAAAKRTSTKRRSSAARA